MINLFNRFQRKKSPLKTRTEVFENIYSNLLQDWLETSDLALCTCTIDVSQFPEPLEEWVKVINENIHIYNKSVFYLEASTTLKCGFLSMKKVLVIKFKEPPLILSGSIKA